MMDPRMGPRRLIDLLLDLSIKCLNHKYMALFLLVLFLRILNKLRFLSELSRKSIMKTYYLYRSFMVNLKHRVALVMVFINFHCEMK